MLGQSAKRAPRAIRGLVTGACGAGLVVAASLYGCGLDSAGLESSEAQATSAGAGGAMATGAGGGGDGGGTTAGKVTLLVKHDTYVEDQSKSSNFGSNVFLRLYNTSRPLLRFHVDSIPFGAKITEAKLSIFIEEVDPSALMEEIRVHAILGGNKGWVEGLKNGSVATEGEPSWDLKDAKGVLWAGDKGLDLEDTDYKAEPEDAVATKFKAGQPYVWDLSPGLVQQWADDEATNHGILLRTGSAYHYILTSKESAQTMNHPTLTVSYTVE
jgi:hypothetical protein